MLRNIEISAKLQKASDIKSRETADNSQLKFNKAYPEVNTCLPQPEICCALLSHKTLLYN
jgi:hypothetical protein